MGLNLDSMEGALDPRGRDGGGTQRPAQIISPEHSRWLRILKWGWAVSQWVEHVEGSTPSTA